MPLYSTSRPGIRLRVLTKLPATLAGAGDITITKVNGVWTISSALSGTKGTAVLDFGAFPGASDAIVAVTGQSSIAANAIVQAWIALDGTPDHSADEHIASPPRVYAGAVAAGVGFTIYGVNDDRFGDTRTYGRWSVNWRYQ